MPLTVSHVLSATTPNDPAYEIRPEHWNSGHAITFTPDATEVIKWISAGTTSASSGTIVFSNANGVSFGMDAGTITGSVAAGVPSPVNFSAGTRSADLGSIVFSDANGISFGLGGVGSSVMTGSHNALTTARASNDAIGLNTALTANGVSVTANSAGLSLNFPAFLTTARASTDAVGLATAQTNVTWTVNSAGISFNAGGYAGTGFTSTTTAGTDVKATNNTAGLSMAMPAFLTTAQAPGAYLTTARASNDAIGLNTAQTNVTWTVNSAGLSLNAAGYAGTATTFNGANISGSMTMNSVGLQLSMSVAAPGGGGTAVTMYATSNTTQSTSITAPMSSLIFAGAGAISVGVSNGSVVISGNAAAGDGVNIISMLTSTSGGGTAGATYSNSTGSIGLMAGSNITLSQTSNTIVFNAPNSSSLVGASGISMSSNGATISVYQRPVSSHVCPDMALSVLGAMGNGSFSIAYRDIFCAVSATRVDAPFAWQQATTANANTIAIAMTVLCGIYTRNASTLNTVSSASTQTTYTYASNSAGNTQLTVNAYRPISLPMNVNMSAGQYYMGFGISTNVSSIGTATTTAAQTISAVGVPQGSSAVPWTDEFTRVTGTSVGMFSGHGIYSAAVASVVPAISLSAINQSGSYFHRANVALVFRG